MWGLIIAVTIIVVMFRVLVRKAPLSMGMVITSFGGTFAGVLVGTLLASALLFPHVG